MKISIITSTYLEFQTSQLQRAINSVINQTGQNWEMIIVGDCAPGGRQIDQYLTKLDDQRLKFINLTTRAGTDSPGTVPKIEGIKQAQGDLLCFLDADNMFLPNHLEFCAREFQKQPDLDLVYANTLVRRSKFLSFVWHKPDWNARRQKLLMSSNFLDMSETVFTRQAYDDAGGLDSSHQSSDWILWKKMIQSGHDNFRRLDHVGLVYQTTNLKHCLEYFGLMLLQNSGIRYHSDKLKFVQRDIQKRFQRKHQF